ncbi:hypothetical protein SteCoe_14471 [Stentor coeruleus]|uniref:Uncharacterized protein n=1 Tax=Stentor coeruleus TaxID=5963 RepID=A0A1R2C5Z3_9CILI|nr:hypothetical protein SteCoe_14471 [Stentor coeruleus]
MSLPPANIVLEGHLVRKIQDRNSGLWDGLSLREEPSEQKRKSEMRWKDFEHSKRTIDPSFSEDTFRKISNNFSYTPVSNITDMINRGFSNDNLGKMNKKVAVGGKSIHPNAMSFENVNVSQGLCNSYRELHPGHGVTIEKRQRKPAVNSEEKLVSQISTLPGYHREVPEEVRQIKIKPDYNSSIYELPGFLKTPEKEPEQPNPMIKFTRNTATSIEQTKLAGPQREKAGPKTEIIPSYANESTNYSAIGKETDLNPYSRGKMRNDRAEDKLLRGTVDERDLILSKKGRPASSRNMFASSFSFA